MESGIYVCVCDGMLLMCVLCVYVLLMDDAVGQNGSLTLFVCAMMCVCVCCRCMSFMMYV